MRLALFSLLLAGVAFGQTPQPQLEARFDAASVKMTAPSGGGGHSHEHDNPGLFRGSMTLKSYIMTAYEVSEIAGGPPWMDDATYEIEAKLDLPRAAALSPDKNEAMLHAALQPLLAERFHLKVHHESKEVPAYLMTVTKRGFKLQPVAAGEHCGTNSKGDGHVVTLNATCIDMEGFAAFLAKRTKMPVSDQTGVKGAYTFSLQWTPDDLRTDASSDRPPLPSLFTVLEEQLGLKLEQRKAAVDILVVDSAERPTEN